MNTFGNGLVGGMENFSGDAGMGTAGGTDEASLKNQKLDAFLRNRLASSSNAGAPLNVIVQTVDGLKPEDRRTVESLGGKIKDDLYIIKAFSAELTVKAIEMMILSPRVTRIFIDDEVHA